jgi:hypothetical protein
MYLLTHLLAKSNVRATLGDRQISGVGRQLNMIVGRDALEELLNVRGY